jgi:dCMP deaminase
MSEKRTDYINWQEFFMGVALLSAQRSKDPSTQVGACLVKDTKIISTGYNGFPTGCSDDLLPWKRESENGNSLDTKYFYVVHAESNCILNARQDIRGSTIYCTLFPCAECTKMIIQSGITKVVYMDDKYHDEPSWVASRRMLDLASVHYVQFKLEREITLNSVSF